MSSHLWIGVFLGVVSGTLGYFIGGLFMLHESEDDDASSEDDD